MKEDVEARTAGLTGKAHMNIPAVATESPAGSDSGSVCTQGLEPWNNKGSLGELGIDTACFISAAHVKQTRVKSGLPKAPS